MEESIHCLTIKIRQHKKGMNTNNIDKTMGFSHAKLRHQMSDNVFFKQLPIEDSNSFEKILSNEF